MNYNQLFFCNSYDTHKPLFFYISKTISAPTMAWKKKYRCDKCGYEADLYEGRGLFRQQITAVRCHECHSIQQLVVGGIIADVAPSFSSEVGRLCLKCGSNKIEVWDKHSCPKCDGTMKYTGEKEFWT